MQKSHGSLLKDDQKKTKTDIIRKSDLGIKTCSVNAAKVFLLFEIFSETFFPMGIETNLQSSEEIGIAFVQCYEETVRECLFLLVVSCLFEAWVEN